MNRRSFLRGAAGLFVAATVPIAVDADEARRFWSLDRTMANRYPEKIAIGDYIREGVFIPDPHPYQKWDLARDAHGLLLFTGDQFIRFGPLLGVTS